MLNILGVGFRVLHGTSLQTVHVGFRVNPTCTVSGFGFRV